jgi:hypothetical protein
MLSSLFELLCAIAESMPSTANTTQYKVDHYALLLLPLLLLLLLQPALPAEVGCPSVSSAAAAGVQSTAAAQEIAACARMASDPTATAQHALTSYTVSARSRQSAGTIES